MNDNLLNAIGYNKNYLTNEMNKSLELENKYLKKIAFGKVLDLGCGVCRPLKHISPVIKSYTGVEINKELCKLNRKIFKNIKIINIDANLIDTIFKPNSYDLILCLWDTLSLLNYKKTINNIKVISKNQIYISLVSKGCLKDRINYYKKLNVKYKVNYLNETITSEVWGKSKAYNQKDIIKIAKDLNYELVDQGNFGKYLIYGLYNKK
jgi:SAM-dependent methyltransferase